MQVVETLKRWNARLAGMRELNALDSRQCEALAADAGISVARLMSLTKRGPDASDEMWHMLKALPLDAKSLEQKYPDVFRDMSIICAECSLKSQCRSQLRAGRIGVTYRDFCPNAPTIDALAH